MDANALRYEDTLGYKISLLRMQRRMSEYQLAEEVNKLILAQKPDTSHITANIVGDWELNGIIPNEVEFNALSKLLIDKNEALSGADKEKARVQFEALYRAASEAKGTPEYDEAKRKFGKELRTLRQETSLIRDTDLAKALSSQIEAGHEVALIAETDIHDIGAARTQPSTVLFSQIVEVLGKHKPLSGPEKADLDERSKQREGESVVAGAAPETSAETARYRTILLRPSELRSQLVKLIPSHISNKEIGDSLGINGSELTAIRPARGGASNLPLNMSVDKMTKIGAGLRLVIEENNKKDDGVRTEKLAAFDSIFPAFVEAVQVLREAIEGQGRGG